MDYIFLNGSHNKILVLGYGFSDKFDINPYLQSLPDKKKSVIVVQHDNVHNDLDGIEIDELIDISVNNPFYNLDGIKIHCNTRTFIENIWNIYEKEIGSFIGRKSILKWETHLNSWVRDVSNYGIREEIAGKLFESISNFKKAKMYYSKSLTIATRCKKPYPIYHCHLSLGRLAGELNKSDEAFFHFNKALEVINNSDFGSYYEAKAICKANCYSYIGQAYAVIKNYKEAIKNYNLGLDTYKLLGDDHEARTKISN